MEAFACELPVFSTKTGNTVELMEKHNAGCLVGTKNYKEWEEKLSQILETRQLPKILDRNIAKEHYDWPIIADKFINIYREALEMNK
jgi:glycosyltransferase involved in cell wall biosynthesis